MLILPPQHHFLNYERCSGSTCAAGIWQNKPWATLPPSEWKCQVAVNRLRLKPNCHYSQALQQPPGLQNPSKSSFIRENPISSNWRTFALARGSDTYTLMRPVGYPAANHRATSIAQSACTAPVVYFAARQLMSAHYVAHRLMGGVLLRLTVGQGRSIDGTLNKSYTRLGN